MKKGRSAISGAESAKKIGEFWDSHDLGDYWSKTDEAKFDVELEDDIVYYSLEKALSDGIQVIAKQRGESAGSLLNRWVKEKIGEESLK